MIWLALLIVKFLATIQQNQRKEYLIQTGRTMAPVTLERHFTSVNVPNALIKPWNSRQTPTGTEPQYVACLGDIHGNFQAAAAAINTWNTNNPRHTIANAFQAGDLEAIRDPNDLATMVAPSQHLKQGDFARFNTGMPGWQNIFPASVYAVGGNHEAHGHLEAENGRARWISDRFFYMGRAFVGPVKGLTVASLSGIHYKDFFEQARPNVLPNSQDNRDLWRPWVSFRKSDLDVFEGINNPNILMVHDWPEGLASLLDPHTIRGSYNDKAKKVGNPIARQLLEQLKPDILICGHHHMFLSGQIYWQTGEITEVICLDKFRESDPFTTGAMVVLGISPKGVHLHYPQAKIQTPEIRKTLYAMRDEDKYFDITITQNTNNPDDIKETIQAAFGDLTNLIWQYDENEEKWFFIYGGMKFELSKKSSYDDVRCLDAIDGFHYASHCLSVSPHLEASLFSPHRIINLTKAVLQRLQRTELHPVLIASFNDHIY